MSDLTTQEQTNVRTALRFLRARCGGWEPLAKAVGSKTLTLSRVAGGRAVSASIAFRVARLAGVLVDDVLAGRYPGAGTCPTCGHREDVSASRPSLVATEQMR
jgi:hypothetical protein